jgi:hypothetical protein
MDEELEFQDSQAKYSARDKEAIPMESSNVLATFGHQTGTVQFGEIDDGRPSFGYQFIDEGVKAGQVGFENQLVLLKDKVGGSIGSMFARN